jgi:hypothetical protein
LRAHLWVVPADTTRTLGETPRTPERNGWKERFEMSIYSLNHRPIGKTTHPKGAAADHVRYVTREDAVSEVLGTMQDEKPSWWASYEDTLRANGRVADRFIIAIPKEVPKAERAALVRDFVSELVGKQNINDLPWVAGIHDLKGNDVENPHVHIVIGDKSFTTKKRVWLSTESGSTERAREVWEKVANRALERINSPTIDRRSYKARGIERVPTRHEGQRPEITRSGGRAREHNRRARIINKEMIAVETELAVLDASIVRKEKYNSAFKGAGFASDPAAQRPALPLRAETAQDVRTTDTATKGMAKPTIPPSPIGGSAPEPPVPDSGPAVLRGNPGEGVSVGIVSMHDVTQQIVVDMPNLEQRGKDIAVREISEYSKIVQLNESKGRQNSHFAPLKKDSKSYDFAMRGFNLEDVHQRVANLLVAVQEQTKTIKAELLEFLRPGSVRNRVEKQSFAEMAERDNKRDLEKSLEESPNESPKKSRGYSI